MDIEDRFKKRPVIKSYNKRESEKEKVIPKHTNVVKPVEKAEDELKSDLAAMKKLQADKQAKIDAHKAAQLKLFNYMGNLGNKYMVEETNFYPEIQVHLRQLDNGSVSCLFTVEFQVDQLEKNAIIEVGKE